MYFIELHVMYDKIYINLPIALKSILIKTLAKKSHLKAQIQDTF